MSFIHVSASGSCGFSFLPAIYGTLLRLLLPHFPYCFLLTVVSVLTVTDNPSRSVFLCNCDLCNCFGIEIILRAFREQENILMRLRASVRNTFRHWIGFVPDDVLAENPTIIL